MYEHHKKYKNWVEGVGGGGAQKIYIATYEHIVCETELTPELTPELALELYTSYVSHIRSYLEHYSFQNITSANYNNL